MSMLRSKPSGKRFIMKVTDDTDPRELLQSARRSVFFFSRLADEFFIAAEAAIKEQKKRPDYDKKMGLKIRTLAAAVDYASSKLANTPDDAQLVQSYNEIARTVRSVVEQISDASEDAADTLFLTYEAAMGILLTGMQLVQFHFDDHAGKDKQGSTAVNPRVLMLGFFSFMASHVGAVTEAIMATSDTLADNIADNTKPSQDTLRRFTTL